MKLLLQCVTSGMTIFSVYLAGNKDWRFSIVGLLNQILWLGVIFWSALWGLLPLCFFLTITYTRNLVKEFKHEPVRPH